MNWEVSGWPVGVDEEVAFDGDDAGAVGWGAEKAVWLVRGVGWEGEAAGGEHCFFCFDYC